MGSACMETAITAKPKAMPAPAAPDHVQKHAAWYCLAAAVGSGILLWMCFQPLALGTYLGWIALVPFLVLVRSQGRPRVIYLSALACGIAFYIPVLQWMRVADKAMAAAWIALSIYCALYFPVALFCVRCLERWKLPLVVTFPLAWIALEYVRCFLMTGFPWYLLAHTQHDLLPMIQITDIGGVFLVSLVVVGVNAFLFDCIYQVPEIRRWFGQAELDQHRYYSSLEFLNRGVMAEWLFRRNLLIEGAVLAILLIGTYSYGVYRLGQNPFKPGPTVCLLQSNLDQRLRESNDDRSAFVASQHFSELVTRAAINHIPPPDLLIWPETSYPHGWYDTAPEFPIEKTPEEFLRREAEVRGRLRDLVKYTKVPHLIGINANHIDEEGKYRRYNRALFVKASVNDKGKIDGRIGDHFDKIHRVPFGEFLPLGEWLPFLSVLTPYEGDFGIQAGEKMTRFKLGKYHCGVLLCYEDTDPFMARRYVEETDDGPGVDFLVNMSNDGWFDGSSEHEEHLAVSRFRAIECRRAMVRSVNMGISAVIDGNGRVLKPVRHPDLPADVNPPVWILSERKGVNEDWPVKEWRQYKQKSGILKATVPLDARFSFYAMTGDWLPIGCWIVLIGCAGFTVVRRRSAAA